MGIWDFIASIFTTPSDYDPNEGDVNRCDGCGKRMWSSREAYCNTCKTNGAEQRREAEIRAVMQRLPGPTNRPDEFPKTPGQIKRDAGIAKLCAEDPKFAAVWKDIKADIKRNLEKELGRPIGDAEAERIESNRQEMSRWWPDMGK